MWEDWVGIGDGNGVGVGDEAGDGDENGVGVKDADEEKICVLVWMRMSRINAA